MRNRNGGFAVSPVLVGAVTVLVIIVAVFLAYNANNGLPFVSTYDLKAPGRSEPDLGLRAAMWTAAVVKDAPVKSGPVYKRHAVEGGAIKIEFDRTGSGLMVGEAQAGKPVQMFPPH